MTGLGSSSFPNPFFSRKKKRPARKPILRSGTSRTHFFLEGPKKKRFRAAKEKGPWESLGQIRSPPGAGERCEKAGSVTARLRRYRAMLSGQIQTPSGRPPGAGAAARQRGNAAVQISQAPLGGAHLPRKPHKAGRNARKGGFPVTTVFYGAGDRSTLPDPQQLFSLGCRPFLFCEKETVRTPKKKAYLGSCRVLLFPAPRNSVITQLLYFWALRPG